MNFVPDPLNLRPLALQSFPHFASDSAYFLVDPATEVLTYAPELSPQGLGLVTVVLVKRGELCLLRNRLALGFLE
jgi:hypothetical protein